MTNAYLLFNFAFKWKRQLGGALARVLSQGLVQAGLVLQAKG
jgi:hypothetical protein